MGENGFKREGFRPTLRLTLIVLFTSLQQIHGLLFFKTNINNITEVKTHLILWEIKTKATADVGRRWDVCKRGAQGEGLYAAYVSALTS